MRTKQWLAIAALAALGLVSVTAEASKKRATVTVVNQSAWEIHHFFLAAVDTKGWGPDQLGDHVVRQGGSFKLTDIPCDSYDVKLVSEDDDECVIEDVDICGGSETWAITSKDLVKCEAASD